MGGRVLWALDNESSNAVSPDGTHVGGVFSCTPGESIQKLAFADFKGKKVEIAETNLRSIRTNDAEDELWVLTREIFVRAEFNENTLSEPLQVRELITFPHHPVYGVLSGNANIVPINGTNSLALATSTKVNFVTIGEGLQRTCMLNLQIQTYCPMPRNDGAILLHSPECIRLVEKESFSESIHEGNLRERIWERSHKLFTKGIVMDLPLIAYDSRRQQIITDTDARVFTWLDIY